MKLALRSLASLTLLALGAARAAAHDFWIQPASFVVQAERPLQVRLMVGDFGRGENVPRKDERILRFVLATRDGEKPLVGRDGQEIAGLVRPEGSGLAFLAYESTPAFVELEAEKFERYLVEKGLDSIRELRERRRELHQPARELYSRSAKALIRIGEAPVDAQGFDRPMALPLELIPEKNPLGLAPEAGDKLPLRLYFQGKPLAGALVGALCLDQEHQDASTTLHVRTDAEGRCELTLPRRGRVLIAAVHMQPAETNDHHAQWRSYWGSLTFEIPSATTQAK